MCCAFKKFFLVAEFEMWLNRNGQLADFISLFNTKSNVSWEKARIDYYDPIVTDTIAEVLGEINKKPAEDYEDILDKLEENSKRIIIDNNNKNEKISTVLYSIIHFNAQCMFKHWV